MREWLPNHGLQRTAIRRSAPPAAAEAGSFGGRVKLILKAGLCVGAMCVASCASQPPLSGQMRDYADTCRGWMTYQLPPRAVRRVSGFTRLRGPTDEMTALPNVDVVLIPKASGRSKYMVRSSADGSFAFGRIDWGTYTLKTCLDGFNTIEVELTVTPSSAAVDPLYLDISLSS